MLTRRGFVGEMAGLLGALAVASVTDTAQATTMLALTLRELVARSRAVVVATPMLFESRWESIGESQRIVTYSRLVVSEAVAGSIQTREVMVRTLGGRVGDIGQIVHGEANLRKGKRALTFLSSLEKGHALAQVPVFQVTAMAQGHYPIVAQRGRTPYLTLDRMPALLKSKRLTAADQLGGIEFEQAKALIRGLNTP